MNLTCTQIRTFIGSLIGTLIQLNNGNIEHIKQHFLEIADNEDLWKLYEQEFHNVLKNAQEFVTKALKEKRENDLMETKDDKVN